MNLGGRRSSSASKNRISMNPNALRKSTESFSDNSHNRFDERFSLNIVIWWGYLFKSGKNDNVPTKSRFFILHRDHTLTYHNTPKDFVVGVGNDPTVHSQLGSCVKGTIPLVDAKLEFNEGEESFSITVPGRLFYLKSDSPEQSIKVVKLIKDSINATHKLTMKDELVVDPYMPLRLFDDYACMILPESTLHPDMFTKRLDKIVQENEYKYNEIKNAVVRDLNRNVTESEKRLMQEFLKRREETRTLPPRIGAMK